MDTFLGNICYILTYMCYLYENIHVHIYSHIYIHIYMKFLPLYFSALRAQCFFPPVLISCVLLAGTQKENYPRSGEK